MTYRLGILETHPIQYKAAWFRALHARPDVDLRVFYCMLPDARQQGEGFGVEFEWDQPLLEGYRYEVLENRSRTPSVTRFSGCHTPGIRQVIRAGMGGEDLPWSAFIINGWVVRSCVQALCACRRAGVPAILRCEANGIRKRAAWKTAIHRLLLSRFSAFLAIGVANREFYERRGVAQDRIFSAPYGIDNERFAAGSAAGRREREDGRRRWGIPPQAFCFIFSGKFEEKKRPMDLLQAVKLAIEEQRGIHVLMVGDGALRAGCEAYAQKHRLPVSFAGFLNQGAIPAAYAAADCLVLPSACGETWGLVVNEAMACGLPAIVSDQVGCHADLVTPGVTGYTYAGLWVPALARLLARAAADPSAMREMGRRAVSRVAAYRVEAVVDGTMHALEYLARKEHSLGLHSAI